MNSYCSAWRPSSAGTQGDLSSRPSLPTELASFRSAPRPATSAGISFSAEARSFPGAVLFRVLTSRSSGKMRRSRRALRGASSDAIPAALADGSLSIIGDPAVANLFAEVVRLARRQGPTAGAVKPPISVIGLGRLGSGIAGSLLKAGFPVTAYNRAEDKVRRLVEAGATSASTPAAAARAAKFVVTSLMGVCGRRVTGGAARGTWAG